MSKEYIELRGVIEISNYCLLDCKFCGNAKSSNIKRYRLTKNEVIRSVDQAYELGIKVIHLASGYDLNYPKSDLIDIIKYIKSKNQIIELAIGKRNLEEFKEYYEAGADNIILKFETSNQFLLKSIGKNNIDLLELKNYLLKLKKIGFRVGSGNIIGLPNQTLDDIEADIEYLKELDLDFVSTSVFQPNVDSKFKFEKKGNDKLGYQFLKKLKEDKKYKEIRFSLNSTLGDYKWIFLKEFGGMISLNLTPKNDYSLYNGQNRKKLSFLEIKELCRKKGLELR